MSRTYFDGTNKVKHRVIFSTIFIILKFLYYHNFSSAHTVFVFATLAYCVSSIHVCLIDKKGKIVQLHVTNNDPSKNWISYIL